MILAFRLYDQNYQTTVERTLPNHLAYCLKHNYSMLNFCTPNTEAKDRIEYFGKTEWLWFQTVLRMFRGLDAEWVWLMGTDSLVMNHQIKLETIISAYKGDIIVSSDQAGLSTHSMLLRNCENTRNYLTWMLNRKYLYENAQYYFQKNPEPFIKVVPQRVMNSYDSMARLEEKNPGSYEKGDFIIHFTCMEEERRLKFIDAWLGEKHGS